MAKDKYALIQKILNGLDSAYTVESAVRVRVAGALTKLSYEELDSLWAMTATRRRR